jgi:hypothetical protein
MQRLVTLVRVDAAVTFCCGTPPSSCHVASAWASSASARAALAGVAVLLRAYNLRRKKVLGR